MTNAHVHHLCLWFLLYGESANLRHVSEVMCYIFHAAMCAMVLEDKVPEPHAFNSEAPPAGPQLVIAKPVAGSDMPYATDDYLNSIVRPLYTFLKQEVSTKGTEPIVDRIMYDDVNEFFWLQVGAHQAHLALTPD